MGKLLHFPAKVSSPSAEKREEPVNADTLEAEERMKRIRASLARINQLMLELKKYANINGPDLFIVK